MKKPAVFIDRDGTVNEQLGYINHIARFFLLPGTAQAIRLLNQHGHLAIIVSNQSGVARGYFPIELVYQVHDQMQRLLANANARMDGVFFCPHHPNGKMDDYRLDCDCRKPQTGLIQKAFDNFDIDRETSYVVGDRTSDVEMAHRAGLKAILVQTGYGLGEIDYVLPTVPFKPLFIARDLLHAVQWILQRNGKI